MIRAVELLILNVLFHILPMNVMMSQQKFAAIIGTKEL